MQQNLLSLNPHAKMGVLAREVRSALPHPSHLLFCMYIIKRSDSGTLEETNFQNLPGAKRQRGGCPPGTSLQYLMAAGGQNDQIRVE